MLEFPIKRTIVIDDTKANKKSKKSSTTKEKLIIQGTVKKRPVAKLKKPKVPSKNAKNLVIVESPAKAKTIERFLGKDYKVLASCGHLCDLPRNQLGIDLENGFLPTYINMWDKRKIIAELQAEYVKSKNVFLATDPDREGEAISWHLAHLLEIDPTAPCRIMFHEITEKAITASIANPAPLNLPKVDAQQARRVLDRIVGYSLSPLLWKKVCKGLSAGRVQSVAVRLICEREEEINAFVPEEYWKISGIYKTDDNISLSCELVKIDGKKAIIQNKEQADQITQALLWQQHGVTHATPDRIVKMEKRRRRRQPQPPFVTSTLQQECIGKLNFGAKKTMMLAQQLYEGLEMGEAGHVGLITYMRTDSTRINEDMIQAARTYIQQTYGDNYVPAKPRNFKTKQGSQDAHEAIRPTSLEYTPTMVSAFLSRDQLRLYTLIWNRFLASQMEAVETENMTLSIQSDIYELRASGYKVIFKGFTELYEDQKKEKDEELPELKKETIVQAVSITPSQHFTQPPARYTEASLIKTMEEKGIGRPSTYAPIMDTIQRRNYVEKKEKQFIPTELGIVTISLLKKFFEQIINVDFTAHMEKELDGIEQGNVSYTQVIGDFYNIFKPELNIAEKEMEKVKVAGQDSGQRCEKCGAPLVYKFGRFGKFLACSNFPTCRNTKAIIDDLGISCPKCGKGTLIRRKSKRGRLFYGCSEYPNCEFVLWNEPTNKKCSLCGSMMTIKHYKRGADKLFCSNETCENHKKGEVINEE
ncbi:type I DNA topoisomerase [uncultured Megasphaera sp.]|uniref:type I DNA topoisomerase n=1 Tax=uncultured Megasphaera sp. TaxID=165188 RepID=UPI0012E16E53|nr:type I DNA topoisomerase [uncultured Megasphaera sp.]MUP48444.1 type I DNA topoisomerase [Veillonellaceae bacterium M2-8]MUP58966.1 type I DNA topoisomerase [Veillonellaceae bacterium M2-4]